MPAGATVDVGPGREEGAPSGARGLVAVVGAPAAGVVAAGDKQSHKQGGKQGARNQGSVHRMFPVWPSE